MSEISSKIIFQNPTESLNIAVEIAQGLSENSVMPPPFNSDYLENVKVTGTSQTYSTL